MTTTSQYGLGVAQYRSGTIMGVTQDARDNAIDVIYSTKPDRRGTLNAMSTSTTTQPFTTTRDLVKKEKLYILKYIYQKQV